MRNVGKSSDGLDEFSRSNGVELYSGTGCYRKVVVGRREEGVARWGREGDVGDGGGRGHILRRLEGFPVDLLRG